MVVALIPSGTMAGWAAASLAIVNALGTDTDANHGIVQIAAIATVGLSLLVAWATITLVHWPAAAASEDPKGIDEPAGPGLHRHAVKSAAS